MEQSPGKISWQVLGTKFVEKKYCAFTENQNALHSEIKLRVELLKVPKHCFPKCFFHHAVQDGSHLSPSDFGISVKTISEQFFHMSPVESL